MPKTAEAEQDTEIATRPPIVVVVGHIDHGKTSLLDYIRKTAVAAKETGGITQHIGAYQIEHNAKRITFIDTPGHEAFSAMRVRGTHVADIAVLVVAADEGVKPQTEEAIAAIRDAELPFVVALNKIDKPNADAARVKKELAEREVLVEGFGGTVPVVELSAKTGQGVDALLETLLLLAELEELKWDAAKPGEGVVIESHLDPKRGAAATLLVEDGTVKRGQFIAVGESITPVRIFENFRGEAMDSAAASEPIRIIGFPKAPPLGEAFRAFDSKRAAGDWAAEKQNASNGIDRSGTSGGAAAHIVNIVLKTDVLGSQEALGAAIEKIRSQDLAGRIVKNEVGDIGESDVKFAAAAKNAFIAGFRVKFPPPIRELAERHGVTVVTGDIIYDLLEAIKAAMLAIAPTELKRVELGSAKILALFKEDRGKQIVGGRIESGVIKSNARFDTVRNGIAIGSGRILELQSGRKPAEEVPSGQEFGAFAEASPMIAAGDTLNLFAEEMVTPKL